MCTIHLFPAEYAAEHIKHIELDYVSNCDGTSLLVIEGGEIVSRIQSLKLATVVKALKQKHSTETLFAVHLRASTSWDTGCQAINGCHWFPTTSGDWTYCHNGIIEQGRHLRVDSLILDNWLNGFEPEELEALPYSWANVVAVHNSGRVMIHRSKQGSLYSSLDCKRYSTKPMLEVDYPVSAGWHKYSAVSNRDDSGFSGFSEVKGYRI